MVSGSLGWAQMPTCRELLRPGLSRFSAPLIHPKIRSLCQARRVGELELDRMTYEPTPVLHLFPQGWLREGRAGKLADDPRSRLASLHPGTVSHLPPPPPHKGSALDPRSPISAARGPTLSPVGGSLSPQPNSSRALGRS